MLRPLPFAIRNPGPAEKVPSSVRPTKVTLLSYKPNEDHTRACYSNVASDRRGLRRHLGRDNSEKFGPADEYAEADFVRDFGLLLRQSRENR